MYAPSMGDGIVPKLTITTVHEPSSAVMGIGESSLSNIGKDGDAHPYPTPLLNPYMEAENKIF